MQWRRWCPGGSRIILQMPWYTRANGSLTIWLTAKVTATARTLGVLRQHHRALGDVENSSTRTARKRHSTLSPQTRVTPTAASSRNAMSAKTN